MPILVIETQDGTPEGRPTQIAFIKSLEQLQKELEVTKEYVKDLEEAIAAYPHVRTR